MGRVKRALFSFFFISTPLYSAGITYTVDFQGLDDVKALKTLRSTSQLIALRKKNPNSINALRFRAESDIPDLIRALRAHGYLEAEIDMQLEERHREYGVLVSIRPGPLYHIENFEIILKGVYPNNLKNRAFGKEGAHILESGASGIVREQGASEDPKFAANPMQPKTDSSSCLGIDPLQQIFLDNNQLGIAIGDPLETQKVLDSQLAALQILSEKGFPLAQIENEEIIANGKTHRVSIVLTLQVGPLSYFGDASIVGNSSVQPQFISQYLQLGSQNPYNSLHVENSRKALMDTGLFSSVYITHDKTIDDSASLPMKVEVCETKHKSVHFGTSYQTTFGPGMTFGWENRNVSGMGRRLLVQADIAQKSHSGIASFMLPDFGELGQTYFIQALAWHEAIKPYHMQSYSLLNRFEKQWDENIFFSLGAKVEYMTITHSVDNQNVLLVEAPLFLRWTNVSDFLNPTSGMKFEYRGIPTINGHDSVPLYYSQSASFSSYLPLWDTEKLILAQKMTLSTILSNGINSIPVPKRLFGGSEDHLRGYRYYTVSPLKKEEKPIGGRSAIYYSLETRLRILNSFGIVPFFDIGNVYTSWWPTFTGKWRKSAGIGLRYYSFMGPLRLDLAFPLNRRPKIDPNWWLFVSLGQTF